MWAATTFGFFYMMRCSEYLADGSTFDPVRGLTTDKVLAHVGDTPLDAANFELADNITVLFELAKTDQNRVGCTRTVFATGDDLCPVEAYKALRRVRGANWHERAPVMMDPSGWVMNRECMSAMLKGAAVDCGIPAAELATHSLRIGGATTMAAALAAANGGVGGDDEVRRFGRWKSDCWRRYVYSARSAVRGLAAAMSRVHVATDATAREFRAAGNTWTETAAKFARVVV